MKEKWLFVCAGNAARSQMAEAFADVLLKEMGLGSEVSVDSAGTQPSKGIGPRAVNAMFEIGIDLSKKWPKLLTKDMIRDADLIVIMGPDVEEKRFFLRTQIEQGQKNGRYEVWDVQEPKKQDVDKVREIRAGIAKKVYGLLERKFPKHVRKIRIDTKNKFGIA